MLYDLPEEILIETFDLLECSDLLKLTLVCKKFNNLISISPKLVKKLSIFITARQVESKEWYGTRKYSGLVIYNKKYSEILDAISNDLTDISIRYIKMDVSGLKKILLNCPKLLNLELKNVNYNFDDGCFDEPLPRLDLNSFICISDLNILKMFMCSQTRAYGCSRFQANPDHFEALKKFLKVQKKLEKITFRCFGFGMGLFIDDTLNEVEFRLKHLVMHNIREFENENFKKFLKNHQHSLQHVEMCQFIGPMPFDENCQIEILDYLKSFQNLKSLELYKCKLPTKPMPYVEKLKISRMGFDDASINWGSKFPNVKHLEMSETLKVNEICKLQKLEALSLSNYTSNNDLDKVTIPSTVKKFSVNYVWLGKKTPFISSDHQIEHFIAENISNADWIGDFLRNLKGKLKFLKIDHCLLSRHRRFSRLFEKEPELKNKAKRFVFNDKKNEYDRKSVASGGEDSSEDEEMEIGE